MQVLVAESRSDVRSALRLFLEQDFDNITIVEAARTTDLLRQVTGSCPDMLLLDWELPDMKAARLLAQIRGLCPELYVIATSGRSETRQKAIEAGADAFINKSDTPEQMMDTVKETISGIKGDSHE